MKLLLKDDEKIMKFSTIFRHLRQFSDAMVIYFSDTGMYAQGMDGSNCCLFECKIPANWFDEYSYDSGTDAPQIGVNTAIMQKVIGTLGDKQEIRMSYSGLSDVLQVEFKGSANFNRHFEIALIDLDVEFLEIPKQETHVDLTIQTNKFSELISQLLIFSEILTLHFTEEAINFKASGIEGSMSSRINMDDVTEYAIGEDTELLHSYSLKYLNLMCNFGKMNKDVVLGFSENMPMSLVFYLEEKGEDDSDDMEKDCFLGFYLAPRIDDEY